MFVASFRLAVFQGRPQVDRAGETGEGAFAQRGIRDRLFMYELVYNLLFGCIVGLNMDEVAWVATASSKYRGRLLESERVGQVVDQLLEQRGTTNLLSGEHFTLDGILI